MKYQLATLQRTGYFFLALVFAVALLYFLGDLAENLDKWLSDGQGPLLALVSYVLNTTQLLIRIAPLLVLLSCLFAWTRAAGLGEMTAMEAAGMYPGRHILVGIMLLSLATGLQIYHKQILENKFARWHQMVDSYARSGQILVGGKRASMTVDPDKIEVRKPRLWTVTRNTDGSPLEVEQIWDNEKIIYNLKNNTLVKREDSSSIVFSANESEAPWLGALLWLLAFLAALFAVTWRGIVRHGRSRGLPGSAGRTVILIVVLWGIDQAVAPMFVESGRIFLVRSLVVLALLTILRPWRTIISSR